MIPLLLYAQSTDLVTFGFTAAALGIGGESNPIAALIYSTTGILGVAFYKMAVVAAYAYLAVTWHRFGTLIAVVGIVIGSLGTLTNVAALAVSV